MERSFTITDAVLLLGSWIGVFFFNWCFFGIYNMLMLGASQLVPRLISLLAVMVSVVAVVLRAYHAHWRGVHQILKESYIVNFFMLATVIMFSSLTANTTDRIGSWVLVIFAIGLALVITLMWSQYRGLPWLYDLLKGAANKINI